MVNHPILRKKINIISYITVWGFIAGFHMVVLIYAYDASVLYALFHATIHNLIFGFLGLSIWFIVMQDDPESTPKVSSIINHIGAASLAILFWIAVSDLLIDAVYPPSGENRIPSEGSIMWRVIIGLFYYGALALLYYLIAAYQNLKIRLEKEANLRTSLRESELKALKSQINPHFLFNSLNSISALTFEESDQAREMIIKLSEFMRYTLKSRETNLSSLEQELNNMKKYLDIEKIRFGKRLNVTFHMHDACLNKKIPHLILQPLVENAIKHGVYESIDTNNLDIYCMMQSTYLKITICNDVDKESTKKTGEGLGLINVSNRLKAQYNENASLTWKIHEKRFVVELVIPIQNDESN